MVEVTKHTRDVLLEVAKQKKIYVEGNFLKILKAPAGDTEFKEYLKICKERDTASRKKRLEITRQVQNQNKELEKAAKKNEVLMQDLQTALNETQKAKQEAEKLRDEAVEDLDTLQQKTQFELVGTIVRIALTIIVGVGILTTAMYGMAIIRDQDTQIIGSTWSNMFGILLTNAFSIVGTIMGVKYATEK